MAGPDGEPRCSVRPGYGIGDPGRPVPPVPVPPVPPALRDGHYPGAAKLGNAQTYVYPPDVPGGVAQQQYPPDELVGRDYYTPAGRGAERAVAERLPLLRKAIRGSRSGGPATDQEEQRS